MDGQTPFVRETQFFTRDWLKATSWRTLTVEGDGRRVKGTFLRHHSMLCWAANYLHGPGWAGHLAEWDQCRWFRSKVCSLGEELWPWWHQRTQGGKMPFGPNISLRSLAPPPALPAITILIKRMSIKIPFAFMVILWYCSTHLQDNIR